MINCQVNSPGCGRWRRREEEGTGQAWPVQEPSLLSKRSPSEGWIFPARPEEMGGSGPRFRDTKGGSGNDSAHGTPTTLQDCASQQSPAAEGHRLSGRRDPVSLMKTACGERPDGQGGSQKGHYPLGAGQLLSQALKDGLN